MTISQKIRPLLMAAALLAAPLTAQAQDADALRADDPPAHAFWLETLDLSQVVQDYGTGPMRASPWTDTR